MIENNLPRISVIRKHSDEIQFHVREEYGISKFLEDHPSYSLDNIFTLGIYDEYGSCRFYDYLKSKITTLIDPISINIYDTTIVTVAFTDEEFSLMKLMFEIVD